MLDDLEIKKTELKEGTPPVRVCDRCRLLVTDESHTCLPQSEPSAKKKDQSGRKIGIQYELLSMIGEGGMSTVYKARHILMKKDVAVKLLHAHLLTDETTVRRFQKEAQAASRLDHQHIMKVHDFSVDEDGTPYLVMDLIDGRSLASMIAEEGRLPIDRLIDIISQCCDALEHAHKNGVVHRDIKPSNIMLINLDGKSDFVKILDFGIAKIMMSEGIATQRLTQTGEVFGSPLYMSPEQCMARDLDARSDVYAMGCVLYEAITGSPPLRGGNVFETFYLQAHEKPQSITTHVANIKNARSLDAIILKCMAKNARDRYQSMAELKAALQAYRQEFSGPGFFKTIGKKLELFKAEQSASKKVIPLWKMMLILTGLLFVVGTAAHWSGWLHSQPSGTASEPWEVHNMRGQKAFDDGDYAKARSEFFQALRKALGADGMEALVADSLSKEEPQSPPLIRAVENNAKSDLVGLSVAHLQDLYSTTGKGNQMSAMVKAVNSKRQEQRQSHKDILAEIGAAKDAEHRSELIRNLLDTLPSDDVDARVDAISKALAIVGPSANDIDRARLLGRLGYALMAKGGAQQGKALKCLTESFFIYERLKPRQSYLKPQGSLLVLLAYACDPKDFTELKRLIAQKIVEARKWCGRDSLEIATLKFALGTIYSRQYAAAANDVLRSSVTESKRAAPQQSLSDLRKRAILQFQAATAIYDRQLSMFNAEGKSVSNIEVRLQDYALHNELAGLYRDGNELSKAKHEYASVLKQLEECQQPLWEHLAQVLEQLARMEESKDPAKAAAMYKRALAINKRIGADQRTLSRLEERIEKLK